MQAIVFATQDLDFTKKVKQFVFKTKKSYLRYCLKAELFQTSCSYLLAW
jgi:hypothetical protein